MTLHTRIAIIDPAGVSPREAFERLANQIGATQEQRNHATLTDDAEEFSLWMPFGLGLPALVWVTAGDEKGEQVIPLDEYETSDPEKAKKGDLFYTPGARIMLNFDTGYSYAAPNGAGCGDLHAWIVREVCSWLDEKGATWDWYDESGDGWYSQWKDDSRVLASPHVSPQWGTLGDPDVGDPGSMIPSVTRDPRQAFLQDVVIPAVERAVPGIEWQ